MNYLNSNFIQNYFVGQNYFVCISPSYPNTIERMEVFKNKFKSAITHREISTSINRQIYRFSGGKRLVSQFITRIEKQFIVQL